MDWSVLQDLAGTLFSSCFILKFFSTLVLNFSYSRQKDLVFSFPLFSLFSEIKIDSCILLIISKVVCMSVVHLEECVLHEKHLCEYLVNV